MADAAFAKLWLSNGANVFGNIGSLRCFLVSLPEHFGSHRFIGSPVGRCPETDTSWDASSASTRASLRKFRTERYIAITVPFAMPDIKEHTHIIDVGDLNMAELGPADASRVQCYQHDAMESITGKSMSRSAFSSVRMRSRLNGTYRMKQVWLAFCAAALLLSAATLRPVNLGSHQAKYGSDGSLLPWTSWKDTVDREMNWYLHAPIEHGYPSFVAMTFMNGQYKPENGRRSFIPSMQNGMGVISYLKYYQFTGKKNPQVLVFARYMGDYLVKESLTPNTGKYPRFTRSTGSRAQFPLPPDSGSQDDQPYEIQPDKGGIAGYALALLYKQTSDQRYLDQALQNARVLVSNMRPGDATHSPWPFRADYRTGAARGEISGNMVFNLRLFDWLIAAGYGEFQQPRAVLWSWIRDTQIPTAAKNGSLFVEFFEDHHSQKNRTAWAPLALARYLVERKDALDVEWAVHAKLLIEFVSTTFTSIHEGVAVCGEQDEDRDPWGGINTSYGAVLALYSAATGSPEYKRIAEQALTFSLYAVDEDGCPRDSVLNGNRGGWQEDAHTDKIHNIIDAMVAFPQWAK